MLCGRRQHLHECRGRSRRAETAVALPARMQRADRQRGLVSAPLENLLLPADSPRAIGRHSRLIPIPDKRDVTGASRFERRDACYLEIALALPSSFQLAGDFLDAQHPSVSYKLMPIDPSAIVAATARVHPNAQISAQAVIGEFAIIEEDVASDHSAVWNPYVYVKRWTTLGERNEISAGTVLGTDPLDKGFTGERSYLRIAMATAFASTTRFRGERSRRASPRFGDGNYIMTSGHIAHNCQIGNDCVIASCALVAGHVGSGGPRPFISGGVVIHQYSKSDGWR